MIDAPETILALDVSSSATGMAWQRGETLGFGVIKPKASRPPIERIDYTVGEVGKLIERVQPTLVILEWSSGKTHGRIAKASGLSVLGAAQGAVRESIRGKVPVETVTETTWTGGKQKKTRARAVRLAYPEYARWADEGADSGLDAADALGLLDWHRGNAELERLAAMMGMGGSQ